MRQLYRFLLTIIVLGLLFVPVLRALDVRQFEQALRSASLWPLGVAAGLGLTGCLLSTTLRLRALLAALPSHLPIGLRQLYRLYIASAAAQILLPSPAAELLRTVHLSKRYGYAIEDATAAHLVEKAVDAAVLSMCVLLLLIMGQLLPWMRRPFLAVVAISGLGIVVMIILARRLPATAEHSPHVSAPLWTRVQRFLKQTLASLSRFHSASTWVASAAWSCVSEATNTLTVGLVLSAVGQVHPLPLCLLGALTARLSGALPLTPGQLGVQEGSMALVLSAFGIPPGPAMAAALLYRMVHALPTLLLGGFMLRKVTTEK